MVKHKKKLSVFEAICIIAGYGIGSGVMAVPLFVSKTGVGVGLVALVVAFVASLVLHLMIADITINSKSSQLIGAFEKFLFKGKFAKVFTWTFFVLMGLNLISNLAVYIAGAGEILGELLKIDQLIASLVFYVVAASVVFFGLKVVGVSEKIAIISVGLILIVLATMTFTLDLNALPMASTGITNAVVLFGKVMFVFIAFFSVPQVVVGLDGDAKKVRLAIFGGMGINCVITFAVCLFTLLANGNISTNGIAILDWIKYMPAWAQILGSLFTLLAFITTYWSISLALTDIVKEQLKWENWVCWLVATLPSFVLVIFSQLVGFGFLDFMNIAGGVIAIMIVFLLVPVYKASLKEGGSKVLGKFSCTAVQVAVVLAYLLMVAGSILAF